MRSALLKFVIGTGIAALLYAIIISYWLPPDVVPLTVVNRLPYEIVVGYCHCKANSTTDCGNTYRLGVRDLRGFRATDGRRKMPIEPMRTQLIERYTITGRVIEAIVEFQ